MTHHLTARRPLLIAAFALVVTLLTVLYWQQLVALAVLAGAFHLRRKIWGGTSSRRRRSTLAENLKAGALAYAAWNTRFLNPAVRKGAKVHADTPGTCTTADGTVDVFPPLDTEIPY